MNALGLVYKPKKTITGILEADRVGLGLKMWKSIPVTIVSMALGNVLTAILIR